MSSGPSIHPGSVGRMSNKQTPLRAFRIDDRLWARFGIAVDLSNKLRDPGEAPVTRSDVMRSKIREYVDQALGEDEQE